MKKKEKQIECKSRRTKNGGVMVFFVTLIKLVVEEEILALILVGVGIAGVGVGIGIEVEEVEIGMVVGVGAIEVLVGVIGVLTNKELIHMIFLNRCISGGTQIQIFSFGQSFCFLKFLPSHKAEETIGDLSEIKIMLEESGYTKWQIWKAMTYQKISILLSLKWQQISEWAAQRTKINQ